MAPKYSKKMIVSCIVLGMLIALPLEYVRYSNPRIKTEEVPVPYLKAKLENFVIENAIFAVSFKNEFNFSKGTFKSCTLNFDGTWSSSLEFSECQVENCIISLKTHGTIALTFSTIKDSTFYAPDETCVYIVNGNTFQGTVQIIGTMYVYPNGTNSGMGNVINTP